MFSFITRRSLFLNIFFGLLVAVGGFALFLMSLNLLTGHGKSATVPMVNGKSYLEASMILQQSGFDIEIQDSIYVDTVPPLTVIKQFPEADEVVKSNRTVYLLISRAVPPTVEMPNLLGYSFRNAELILKSMDMKIGDTTFRPDFAKNAVLEQLYKGSPIAPGTPILKGSVISLVLGDGIGKSEFSVPDITGMQFSEAKRMLDENGIIMGAIVADPNVTDTMNSWIYRQHPERYDILKKIQRIRAGQTMDVWLQMEQPVKDSLMLPLP